MPDKVDLKAVFGRPPKDVIAYFEAKGYTISWNWWETWQEAHAGAFTVAKAVRADVLETIRAELQNAMDHGTLERDFVKTLEPRLKALGWWGKQAVVDSAGHAEVVKLGSSWRLKTIYRVNMQTAYMAGRYKAMAENADHRPWWQYVAILDQRTRPAHRALHGRVFRADDPFWDRFYPPNGWNCRCRVRAYTDTELKRKGLEPESGEGRIEEFDIEVGVDKRTGEIITQTVPGFRYTDAAGQTQWFRPDAGWGYNPGLSAFGRDVEIMRKLSLVQDRTVRAQAVQALNNSPLRHAAFAQWADRALAARRPGHAVQVLGFVDEGIAEWVRVKTNEAPARVLVLPEKALVHADSEKHRDAGIALAPEEYRLLPAMVADPEAVLWDTVHKNLIYVYPAAGSDKIKIVVNAPFHVRHHKGRLDVVVNAYKVEAPALHDATTYEVVQEWKK